MKGLSFGKGILPLQGIKFLVVVVVVQKMDAMASVLNDFIYLHKALSAVWSTFLY